MPPRRSPGPVGKGTRRMILDERATPVQREALLALASGTQGHHDFEIFAAVCPNVLEPARIVAQILLMPGHCSPQDKEPPAGGRDVRAGDVRTD